jgi:hypothetical protein
MDLKQRKLTKSEWDTIEIPVSASENSVLQLIIQGYHDVNIKINKNNSLFTFLKVEYNPQNEDYLYNKYFADKILQLVRKYNINFIKIKSEINKNKLDGETIPQTIYNVDVNSIVKLKSADQIRLNRINTNIDDTSQIYEFILIKHIENLFSEKGKNKHWQFHYYTLLKLLKNNIEKLNRHIFGITNAILINLESEVEVTDIIHNSVEYIEKNVELLRYSDLQLYDHQKTIFTAVKVDKPKLVLYIAPTGTGKTLTPLGLSENHKIIFVCAARHVGLALARSAISINKKIAFAFGCSSADDVRLHYFAASEYSVNKKTGKIKKVDNSVGNKVEIIICDIRSYLFAMYYMLAFNSAHEIITYWDEPTITLDYSNHELHKIIKKNWKDNIIPNVVLSSATLPKLHELTETITDFRSKFDNCNIVNIVSHDCKKTIPLINNNGYVVMPHYLSPNYSDVLKVVEHCEDNLTLLRYFDLEEASNFILFVDSHKYIKSQAKISRAFESVSDVDMKNIKLHYLKTLKNIIPEYWTNEIYNVFILRRNRRITPNVAVDTKGNKITKTNSIGPGVTTSQTKGEPLTRTLSQQAIPINNQNSTNNGICGVYVTTLDAHTLTDGPTIYLANDVQKIAKFCIQQANIPSIVMNDILQKIEFNNSINEKISQIEQEIQDAEEKLANKKGTSTSSSNDKKDKKNKDKIAEKIAEKTQDNKILRLREQIELLSSMIKNATLNDMFIPNKMEHLKKWTDMMHKKKSFTCDIDEDTIISIMLLKDVEDSWKILLLLGIGVFTEHKSNAYTEIMKKLADQQKLYLIIADSDYIYGTNYQFCHGYLSKDLKLTQEKIIQAMGRIGRNNIQQEYSVRFRDDEQINTLFTKIASENKPEVLNMNTLFNSRNVTWDGSQYREVDDQNNEDNDENDLENESEIDEDDDDEHNQEIVRDYISDKDEDEN